MTNYSSIKEEISNLRITIIKDYEDLILFNHSSNSYEIILSQIEYNKEKIKELENKITEMQSKGVGPLDSVSKCKQCSGLYISTFNGAGCIDCGYSPNFI